jgi:tetratricopeptide (TPR) repeat protein
MGWWWLALRTAGATAVASATALDAQAQPPRPAPPGGPLVIHRDPADGAVGVGRARMSKGDYAGALEAFDAALRTSTDPVLHRDRGLCHEQLGHPFPAMDDFRYYLTALPDAPDSEDIRNRLNQLETANGMGGTGTGAAQPPGAPRLQP